MSILIEGKEGHRAATTLELLYDLISVISISIAAEGLHHAILHNHVSHGFLVFMTVFFAIWWAWMNFTWFASSYERDDVVYRIAVFVQMTGSMILASGIYEVYSNMNFKICWFGFLIMRASLVFLWSLIAFSKEEHKKLALLNILGLVFLQMGWFILAFKIPEDIFLKFFFLMVVLELSLPFVTKRKVKISWHMSHIVERYNLLTIIVLGECFLALVNAMKMLNQAQNYEGLLLVICSSLVITFSMWWLYFNENEHAAVRNKTKIFLWGYGHFFIFLSIAVIGAIFSALIEGAVVSHLVNISLIVFLIGLWLVHDLPKRNLLIRKMELPLLSIVLVLLSYYDNIVLTSIFMLILSIYRSVFKIKDIV